MEGWGWWFVAMTVCAGATWGLAGALLATESGPAPGVHRVRAGGHLRRRGIDAVAASAGLHGVHPAGGAAVRGDDAADGRARPLRDGCDGVAVHLDDDGRGRARRGEHRTVAAAALSQSRAGGRPLGHQRPPDAAQFGARDRGLGTAGGADRSAQVRDQAPAARAAGAARLHRMGSQLPGGGVEPGLRAHLRLEPGGGARPACLAPDRRSTHLRVGGIHVATPAEGKAGRADHAREPHPRWSQHHVRVVLHPAGGRERAGAVRDRAGAGRHRRPGSRRRSSTTSPITTSSPDCPIARSTTIASRRRSSRPGATAASWA